MTGHIYIYNPFGIGDGGDSIASVTEQIKDHPDAETLEVHINTPGGSVTEGFGIRNVLINSGKKVRTIIEGKCYSIGTVIFLAGRERIMMEGSEFMIHNPWMGAGGDAAEMRKAAERLEKTEGQLLDLYEKETGQSRGDLTELMAGEAFITPDMALQLGFATEVLEPVKAFALLENNNKTMDQKQSLFARFFGGKETQTDPTELKALCDLVETQAKELQAYKTGVEALSDMVEANAGQLSTLVTLETKAEEVEELKTKIAELEAQAATQSAEITAKFADIQSIYEPPVEQIGEQTIEQKMAALGKTLPPAMQKKVI